ncbi:hypothetical protein [Actinophytocola oryzae]|uniref:Uncharacterized protein n=1 Tax=Actinophytocola oryzae TaxID=502181 RepID=A0A4R7VMZ8_9PSEU|nr:hypothetical protein [Actinophytocola oryzae]TDV51013.1 hypothetical protein CLV71_106359 [Actinophytocola oryzae]
MADSKRALVLHLTGSGEPAVFALSDDAAGQLGEKLAGLMQSATVEAVALADGSTVAVNFAHVATAHLDELPPNARIYGNAQPRRHGFAT